MRKIGYILMTALLALAACSRVPEPEMPGWVDPTPEGTRVTVSFKVAVPTDEMETKAMGNTPSIDPNGFYVAVFGGSGYFNEWVKATVTPATTNYSSTNLTVYDISADLSVSDSRLRLHFIANCPASIRTSPPISGSQDTEEYVLSRIRSQLTDTYNDGYWQKIILPNGVRAENEGTLTVPHWVPTDATLAQFPEPIVLVRNFARVYLRNLTRVIKDTDNNKLGQEVVISEFALAYAPSEGVIAPILSAPFASSSTGSPISEPAESDHTTPVYYENFLMNYQRYPIASDNQADTLVTAAPFNYGGFSPSDQAYNYYPANDDPGIPTLADMKSWDVDHPENNVLFVYERTSPSTARRATRVIIHAQRFDYTDPHNPVGEGLKYYALDIVNTAGVTVPLLRNQTYTVLLLNIEAGSGETDISKASEASSATVSGDPNYQTLGTISDGKSSIGTSFTEKFYVKPQEDSVMFRYIPTSVTDEHYRANQEGNELVTIKVGKYNAENGDFTELTPAQATSEGILAFKTEGSEYKVWISKENGNVVQYVRSNNAWVEATSAQINDDTVEKWGMIQYQLNESYKDSQGYFNEDRTMAIQVTGSYSDRSMSRVVILKTSQRQTLQVECLQKYVAKAVGEEEVVRLSVPTGLSRSVFPLEFKIEAAKYSLTPNGDVLPVAYGTSTISNIDAPAFYFVRSVTQEEYDTLRVINGKKVIDCHFKTTLPSNASKVYVTNHYFNDDDAYDEFFNYTQRLFTNQSGGNLSISSNPVLRNSNITFSFALDHEHRTNTVVWWDPTNLLEQSTSAQAAQDKGLSEGNRVLPPIMTVKLTGFTPQYQEDGMTPVTTALVHQTGNTYWYYVGSGRPEQGMANVSLALKVTGAVGSTGKIELSTANITENPLLYATASASATIRGNSFNNLDYGTSELALGLDKTTTFRFAYGGEVVPVTVSFSGLTLSSTTISGMDVTDNHNGTYTLTPRDTSVTTYEFSVNSTKVFAAGRVTLNAENYDTAYKDIKRSTFTIEQNELYFRNASGGDPTGFTKGPGNNGTYVYMNNANEYSYLARSRSNNNYYNNSQMTVDPADFTIENDDATVYFIYRTGNNNNYTYYTATSTLSALMNATTSARVTLYFGIHVSGVSLNYTTALVAPGKTLQLTATVTPNNASDQSVTWESSDPSVATVSSTGLVTVAAGATVGSRATITVTTNDGHYTATCLVKVPRRVWHAESYTINMNNSSNYNTTSFTTSPQNVVFTNSEGDRRWTNSNWTYYKLMGTRTNNGWIIPNYSYSSGYFTVTAPPAASYDDSRIIGIALSYDDGQSNRAVTYLGDGSTNLTGSKTVWGTTNTTSGEQSGYQTVRVTMSCTSASEYDDRNRISSLTVYYGYYTLVDPD